MASRSNTITWSPSLAVILRRRPSRDNVYWPRPTTWPFLVATVSNTRCPRQVAVRIRPFAIVCPVPNDDVAIVLQPAGLIDAFILDRYGIAGYREGDGCALKLVRGVPPGFGNVGDPPAVERMRYRRRSRSDRRHGVDVGLQFRPAGESILLRQRVLRIRQLRGRVYT